MCLGVKLWLWLVYRTVRTTCSHPGTILEWPRCNFENCTRSVGLLMALHRITQRWKTKVATKFNVTFLPLRLCYVNTSTCFSKDAENLATYDYVLWCIQIVCTRHYSLNTVIAFYSVIEWSNFTVSFDRWRVKPQRFRILPRLDQVRNWRPTPQWCCNKCYVLANNSVKNVSVTLWFCLQCSCKKCL